MRVLIADAESRVRRALRVVLDRQPNVDVAGEAKNVDELMSAVNEGMVDMLILDWEMPGDCGKELMAELREQQPDLKIIAVSGRRATGTLAREAGADDFVCKCDSGQRLLDAISRCCEQDKETSQ